MALMLIMDVPKLDEDVELRVAVWRGRNQWPSWLPAEAIGAIAAAAIVRVRPMVSSRVFMMLSPLRVVALWVKGGSMADVSAC